MTNSNTPSGAAVAQAFREIIGPNGGRIGNDYVVDYILQRAREIDAQLHANATPPVSAAPVVDGYTAADIAQASADGFRAGVASVGKCSTHPDAPHGFNRNASHCEDRYVCDCEGWEPPTAPDGDWVVAPRVPSPAMLDHAVSLMLNVSVSGEGGWKRYAEKVWRTMIAAAPAVEVTELLAVIDLIRTGKDGRKYDYAISRADTMVHVAPLFDALTASRKGG